MDKEEARFILRCFRPDGADAAAPEFAEALELAAADRELGEWLARERAQDAEFSSMLGKLALPDGLREEILTGLAVERGVQPKVDEIDAPLIGALAMVGPPDGLREEILAAMEQSATGTTRNGNGSWWRFGLPLAAAAGIALAFSINSGSDVAGSGPDRESLVPGSTVPISYIEEQAIATLESPTFKLDLKNEDHGELFRFITKSGRACPSGCVPKGLKAEPGLGCRVIEWDGKPGAIVCFRRGEDEIVHLVVFRRADVAGELPIGRRPQIDQHGDWAVATWEEGNRVFMLLGQTEKEHLGELF